jgi:hypothetical protein
VAVRNSGVSLGVPSQAHRPTNAVAAQKKWMERVFLYACVRSLEMTRRDGPRPGGNGRSQRRPPDVGARVSAVSSISSKGGEAMVSHVRAETVFVVLSLFRIEPPGSI